MGEHSSERGRASMSDLEGSLQELSAIPKTTNRALYAAMAIPAVYFGTQLVAAPFYPGYSFSQDTASMLGTTNSLHPWIFNGGAMLTGLAGLVGAIGLFQGLRYRTFTILAAIVALCVATNGVLSVKAGLFPMPDPRHASWQFLLPAFLAPPLLFLIVLWRQSVALRIYLALNGLALLAVMPLMMHRIRPVFGQGTQQRIFAAIVFLPIGIAAYVLTGEAGARWSSRR
jgi:hypothetical membrane protein